MNPFALLGRWPILRAAAAAVLLGAGTPATARDLPDFTGMVEKYAPAVVNISTTQHQNTGHLMRRFQHDFQLPDLPEDSPFNDLFRRFFGERGMPGMPDDEEGADEASLGPAPSSLRTATSSPTTMWWTVPTRSWCASATAGSLPPS